MDTGWQWKPSRLCFDDDDDDDDDVCVCVCICADYQLVGPSLFSLEPVSPVTAQLVARGGGKSC